MTFSALSTVHLAGPFAPPAKGWPGRPVVTPVSCWPLSLCSRASFWSSWRRPWWPVSATPRASWLMATLAKWSKGKSSGVGWVSLRGSSQKKNRGHHWCWGINSKSILFSITLNKIFYYWCQKFSTQTTQRSGGVVMLVLDLLVPRTETSNSGSHLDGSIYSDLFFSDLTFSIFWIFFFLAMLMACESSQARDQTHATAATQCSDNATALTHCTARELPGFSFFVLTSFASYHRLIFFFKKHFFYWSMVGL